MSSLYLLFNSFQEGAGIPPVSMLKGRRLSTSSERVVVSKRMLTCLGPRLNSSRLWQDNKINGDPVVAGTA
jgi:hypothetical protein